MIDDLRFVGIDFGTKRIGIAISDPLNMFATPIATIENNPAFWKKFFDILKDYKIKAFVVGYPLKENGENSVLIPEVEKFIERLEKKFRLPIIKVDERYSSSIAEQQILDSVTSRKKRRDKGLIDRKAAAVFLQDFLDENGAH